MPLHRLIEQHWQQPKPLLALLLRPLSRIFSLIAARRREGYLKGRRPSEKLPVPVAVVGNIHAGGTGKTPIVQALVRALQARGVKVGIISRGYGRAEQGAVVLNPESTAAEAGDEPLLLYRSTGAPTAVAAKRVEAGRALLAACPDLELLLADDGLQHYALQRDCEIAVFPAADVGRTLDLLPNGCLREPPERLHSVDAVVLSQSGADEPSCSEWALPGQVLLCRSRLQYGQIYRFGHPDRLLSPSGLDTRRVVAAAAIAKPERFFAAVAEAGIRLTATVALPDHAAWSPECLPPADAYIVTEKDAVKLPPGTAAEIWVLPVTAQLPAELADLVLARCLPERCPA